MSKDKPHHEPKKPKQSKAVPPHEVRVPAPMPLSISRPDLRPHRRTSSDGQDD